MKSKTKTPVRINAKSKEFLFSKMAEGLELAEICKKWPDKVPCVKTVQRKAREDEFFAEALAEANGVLYAEKEAELNRLSKATASEIYPEVEFREAEAALKRRIDALKFSLQRLAPLKSNLYEAKATKVEHKGLPKEVDTGPKFLILNYSQREEHPAIGATYDNEPED